MIPNYNSPIFNVEAALRDSLFSGFPGLATLAKTYGLSESRLKRDFKSTFNKTVFAYYRHLQMQLADNYLKQKKGNKKQIASLLNFESQSNFLICYKKYLKNERERSFIDDINGLSDERYKLFVTQAPFAFAMFDKDLHFLAASKKWVDDYQLQEKVVPGQSLYDIIPSFDKKWRKIFKSALKNNIHQGESEFEHPDKFNIWIKWDIRPWFREDKQIGGILFYSEDITAYKTRMADNENVLEILNKTNSIVKIGTWKKNYVRNTGYWSNATREILEVDDNVQPGPDILFQYYKEGKSRALMKTTFFQAINLGKSFDVQAEIVTAKGNLKQVRVVGYSEFKNGKCEKLFGLFQEIHNPANPLPLPSKQ